MKRLHKIDFLGNRAQNKGLNVWWGKDQIIQLDILSPPSWGSASSSLVLPDVRVAACISQAVDNQFHKVWSCSLVVESRFPLCYTAQYFICYTFSMGSKPAEHFGMTIIPITSSPQMHDVWRSLSLQSKESKTQVSFTLSTYSSHTLEKYFILQVLWKKLTFKDSKILKLQYWKPRGGEVRGKTKKSMTKKKNL